MKTLKSVNLLFLYQNADGIKSEVCISHEFSNAEPSVKIKENHN